MLKFCSNKHCKQTNPQPVDSFYKCKSFKDALNSICCYCSKERQKQYRSKPEAKIKAKVRKQGIKYKEYSKNYYNNSFVKLRDKNKKLIRNYGISLDDYRKMIIQQNHKCKICGIDEVNSGKKGLVVDHDHSSGNIRGLICGPCNRALGYFKDDIDILTSATNYLLESKQSNIIILNKL